MDKHKYHIKQLETILRMVDNDAIPLEQVGFWMTSNAFLSWPKST